MIPLACLFGQHDFLRAYSPGHLRLRCQSCGYETVGLRGPIAPAVAPVVKARKLRPKKPPVLKVVKTRRTA
jgi:hypothetical protein